MKKTSRSERYATCRTCRWYDDQMGDGDGLCRVGSPRILNDELDGLPRFTAIWPVVVQTDWCARWSKSGAEILRDAKVQEECDRARFS